MALSRREFLKITGTTTIATILGGTLLGCSSGNENEMVEEEKKVSEDELWIETEETKYFKPGEHFIWEIIDFDNMRWDYVVDTNGNVQIPEGYEYVSSEPIIQNYYNKSSKTKAVKYNFINNEPVEAKAYANEDGEISYPFPGTVIQLEKNESKVKNL